MYAFNVQATSKSSQRFQQQCAYSGCKLPNVVQVQLTPENGPPALHGLCETHALALMPGYLALAALGNGW